MIRELLALLMGLGGTWMIAFGLRVRLPYTARERREFGMDDPWSRVPYPCQGTPETLLGRPVSNHRSGYALQAWAVLCP
jgi:hypothetical protein